MPLVSRLRAHTPKGKPPKRPRAAVEGDGQLGRSDSPGRSDQAVPTGSQRLATDQAGRLDNALVERGLAPNRTRAQRLIAAGAVRLDGRVERKPSRRVGPAARLLLVLPSSEDGDWTGPDPDPGSEAVIGLDPDAADAVTVADHLTLTALRYVSRGALKLLSALDCFGSRGLTPPRGRRCLDIGASTGGFTQVLLERGADQVVALDVGHGQLSPMLAHDWRVVEMSGTNIRDVQVSDLPCRPEYVVSDVSFISLTYVIPVIARLAAPGAEVILLVKPQFEVGRSGLGKNGIVTDGAARRQSLATVSACARDEGLELKGVADSPIAGNHGNKEYLLWLRQPESSVAAGRGWSSAEGDR